MRLPELQEQRQLTSALALVLGNGENGLGAYREGLDDLEDQALLELCGRERRCSVFYTRRTIHRV
jgi:hypothetical protein